MDATSLIAWALLHFVWQGALVGAAGAFALSALRRSNASSRYAISVLALALMASMPVVTVAKLQAGGAARVASSFETSTEPGPGAGIEARSLKHERGLGSGDGAGTPAPLTAKGADAATTSMTRDWLEALRKTGDAAAPYVVRFWLAGVFLFSLRLLIGWLGVRRLVRSSAEEPLGLLRERFNEMSRRVNHSRAIRLVQSAVVRTPAAVGFLRPVLLWPVSLTSGLTVVQIDLLLAHELAHLKRHDYLVNLLQTTVETALFYHPAVWWLSKRVRDERELSCDDIAVGVTGDPRGYAEALLVLASWRESSPLAVAATGGRLLERIQRLLRSDGTKALDRPRWAAVPLAAAAVAGILVTAHEAPARTMLATSTSQVEVAQVSRSTAKESRPALGAAKPSAVTRFEGNASLLARADWAAQAAATKGLTRYWIGYTVASDPTGSFIYIDHKIPVSTEGSVFMGHLRFKRANRLSIPGVPLEDVIGSHPADQTLVMLGFGSRGPGIVDRVHAASALLPVHFDGRALFWLDGATDAESVALLKRAMEKTATDDVRDDLVAVTAAHLDSTLVFSTLRGFVESSMVDRVRSSAVEEMGSIAAKEAVPFLDRTARNDRNPKVRREAAEALGEQPSMEATKTLGALARTTGDKEVARAAAESLGERQDPAAFDELTELVWSNVADAVRREAVESMGESSSLKAGAELKKIARTHPLEEIRRTALETIGEHVNADEALDILEDAVRRDPSTSVREEALDTLAEIGSERSKRALADLAAGSADVEIKRKSIESLWEKGDRKNALAALDILVKSADTRSAKIGVEILGDLESDESVSKLAALIQTDTRIDIQRAAAEALGAATPVEAAFHALLDIIAAPRGVDEHVQRQAVEGLAQMDRPGVVAELERIARTHANEQVRVTAVEGLDGESNAEARAAVRRLITDAPTESVKTAALEAFTSSGFTAEQGAWLAQRLEAEGSIRVQMAMLDAMEESGDKSVDLLIAVARNNKNRDVRRRALEILAESSDPRAKRELARIIER